MASETRDSPFPSTRWTLILQMRGATDPAVAQRALAQLCQGYWYPLYVFARREGRRPEDAEDVTQGFFAYLLERNLFADAERELGKLRTFLLTAFERFLGDVRDHEQAQRRGGGCEFVSLDAGEGERRYAHEPIDVATPEKLFERSWAMTMLRAALATLATEEADAGRESQFRELEAFLSPDATAEASYSTAAQRLALNEDAVRQAVSRLRKKFREHLRQDIADTLHDPSDAQVEEELASLRAALRG
jgi:RNA polymerase sigma-70 factor (ECF subfamily)